MSKTEQFATRFYKLQQAKQEIAELELSRSLMEQSAALESREQISAERREAQQQRSQSNSSYEWQVWSGYIARLEHMEDLEKQRVQDISSRLSEQRRELVLAHRDTMKWETLSTSYAQMSQMNTMQSEQKESDARAVMRFERR